jgi:hypothetical protein
MQQAQGGVNKAGVPSHITAWRNTIWPVKQRRRVRGVGCWATAALHCTVLQEMLVQ